MSSTPVVTIAALIVGLTVGALFAFLRVPIPAPPELPGVVAIVGIYRGNKASASGLDPEGEADT
jgi:XapX domain-containing protein